MYTTCKMSLKRECGLQDASRYVKFPSCHSTHLTISNIKLVVHQRKSMELNVISMESSIFLVPQSLSFVGRLDCQGIVVSYCLSIVSPGLFTKFCYLQAPVRSRPARISQSLLLVFLLLGFAFICRERGANLGWFQDKFAFLLKTSKMSCTLKSLHL
jgi:hypothetical protein